MSGHSTIVYGVRFIHRGNTHALTRCSSVVQVKQHRIHVIVSPRRRATTLFMLVVVVIVVMMLVVLHCIFLLNAHVRRLRIVSETLFALFVAKRG